MAERKVLIKYYPPDFNPALLEKRTRRIDKQDNVRMMMPLTCRCNTCGSYAYIGTKYNMRKETVLNQRYLGIAIFRFYFKCNDCYSEITFVTDPKNSDYIVEHGATRSYDAYRDVLAAETALKQLREADEEGDSMRFLENRTADSKREIDINDALEEIRINSKRRGLITADQMLQKIFDYQAQNNVAFDEDDDKDLQEAKEKIRVKRVREEDQEEALLNDGGTFDVFAAAAAASKQKAEEIEKLKPNVAKKSLVVVVKKRITQESSDNGQQNSLNQNSVEQETKKIQTAVNEKINSSADQQLTSMITKALLDYSDSD